MRITNEGINLGFQYIYFKAADAYLGEKRAAYGQNFSFSLSQRVPEGMLYTPYDRSNFGDIIIEGTYTDFKPVANLPTLPVQAETTYTVRPYILLFCQFSFFSQYVFEEAVWRVDSMTGPYATYVQMVETLTSIKSILVSGKYTNVSVCLLCAVCTTFVLKATGAIVDLHDAIMQHGEQQYSRLLPSINNVEQCICDKGYTVSKTTQLLPYTCT
jgi:hypothetical protein